MKISLCMLVILLCAFLVVAQESSQEPLRSNHDAFLKFIGEHKFLTTQHYYLNTLLIDSNQKYSSVSSVYVHENSFSHYNEVAGKQVNTVLSSTRSDDAVQVNITHKTKQETAIHTLQYKIIFSLKEKSGVQVELDKEASDVKVDWMKIVECVLKYAPEIYPLIVKCFQEPNVSNCILQLIQPATEIYQCIFNASQSSVSLPRGISTVTKSWSLSNSTIAQYIELGNLNVIDKQVSIETYSSNILQLKVSADIIGTGVLKVYMVSVKWVGSNGWAARGYVKLICQQ